MIRLLRALATDESGATVVEYALIVSLVSMVSYAALINIGNLLESFFQSSSQGLGNVAQYPQ